MTSRLPADTVDAESRPSLGRGGQCVRQNAQDESGIESPPASSAHPPFRHAITLRSRRSESSSSTKNGFPSACCTPRAPPRRGCGEHSVDPFGRLVIAERLQDQGLARGQPLPARPRRPQDQHWPGCLREHPAEQLDQRLGGPVQVVEREDGWAARSDLSRRRAPTRPEAPARPRAARARPATSSPRVSPRISRPASFSSAKSSSGRRSCSRRVGKQLS